jgi:hypothetical protein
MTANVEQVTTSPEPAPAAGPRPTRTRKIVLVAALVLGAVLILSIWLWTSGAQRRAIRDMPVGERRALLARTLENLKSVCQAPADAMRDFCAEQARLALDVPECDDACIRLAEPQLSRLQPPR